MCVCACVCVCVCACVRAFSHIMFHIFICSCILHILYLQHIFMYSLSLPVSCALYVLLPLGLRGFCVWECVYLWDSELFLCACAVFNNDSMHLFVSALFFLPSVPGAYPLLGQNYPFTVVWCARAVPFKSWQWWKCCTYFAHALFMFSHILPLVAKISFQHCLHSTHSHNHTSCRNFDHRKHSRCRTWAPKMWLEPVFHSEIA